MSVPAQTKDTLSDDSLLRVFSSPVAGVEGEIVDKTSLPTTSMTPAQRKLAEQAKALGLSGTVAPSGGYSTPEMTAASLRRQAAGTGAQKVVPVPLEPAPATALPPVQPQPAAPDSTPLLVTVPVASDTLAQCAGIPQPRLAGEASRVAADDNAAMVMPTIEAAPDVLPSASIPQLQAVEPISQPQPAQTKFEVIAAPAPKPEPRVVAAPTPPAPVDEAPKVETAPPVEFVSETVASYSTALPNLESLPNIEIQDEEIGGEFDHEPEVLRAPRRQRASMIPQDEKQEDGEPVAIVGAARSRRVPVSSNRKSTSGTMLKTVGMVFLAQAVLCVFFLGLLWASSDVRGFFRNTMHKILGTPAYVAAAEPRWQPDPNMVTSPDTSFNQMDLMQGKISELERQLSVTPAEAWKELRQLSQRNQLTAYADEAITLGSRKSYLELTNIAETSKDAAQRYGAEAEVLRVRFFYATGSRLGSYKLPTASLYPSSKTKSEEDLTAKELITLLLDQEKAWEVRSRSAYLMGEKRGYDAATALVTAVRTDPSLDVIKEATYSFEEISGYRSPGAFEMQDLLDWWDSNAARLKTSLN
jgi:hypothetical protein